MFLINQYSAHIKSPEGYHYFISENLREVANFFALFAISQRTLRLYHYKKLQKISIVFLITSSVVFNQNNPTAFDLSGGNYSFTYWDSLAPAGTYPANMIFHLTDTQDPGLTVQMTDNYTAAYNLTSQSRINGLRDDGVSFINTSSNGYLGAAVVALNSLGRSNIQITWTAGTITPAGVDRVYRFRLQYRVGTSASWIDVPGPVEYTANSTAGHSQTFGPTTLPSDANNSPIVQVRWKYYNVSGTTGTRPRLRLDDISITSSQIIGATKLAVISINGGQSPTAGVPFNVVVQSQDDSGVPQNVSQNTGIQLSLETGNGVLGGTLSGTILAGTNSVTVSGITYTTPLNAINVYNTAVREPSGLAFNPSDNTLYTVSDGSNGSVSQISLTGSVIRTVNVNGNDMEGITMQTPFDTLFVVEEGLRQIVKYSLTGVKLGTINVNVTGPDNNGLEGIAINPTSKNYYVIKQKDPRLLIELNSSGTEIKRTEITFAPDLSDICFDSELNVLWLVSGEAQMLYKITTDGVLLTKWKLPVQKPEGIAVVQNNYLYITCDSTWKLYVFNKP